MALTMAKPGSSSCRPLVQGMTLLALLLLASIQAGPVMASLEQAVEGVQSLLHHGAEELRDHAPDMANKGLNQGLTKLKQEKPTLKRFIDGVRMGRKVHRYLCKAQGLMDKQNPGGASGIFTVEIHGGDLLSKSFPTLYYSVTSNSVVTSCHLSADLPQVPYPSRTMSVRITGIRVGLEQVSVPPPAYTNLESSLREAVIRQVKLLLNQGEPITNVADKVCSLWRPVPAIAILLGSDNGGVMQTAELSVDATDTVWQQEELASSMNMLCLGIQRTVALLMS